MTDKLRAAAQAVLKAWTGGVHPTMGDALRELSAALAEQAVCCGCGQPPHPNFPCAEIAALAEEDVPEADCVNMDQDAEPDEIGPEWTPCVKRPVTVHVRGQRPDETHVSTREGITPVKRDDLIMRGVDGEEYPIGRSLFDRTYLVGVARVKQDALSMHRKSIESAEPVAWGMQHSDGRIYDCIAPGEHDREPGQYTVPLYTAPPRREWVSLTEEEIGDLYDKWYLAEFLNFGELIAAIESALKEKNG